MKIPVTNVSTYTGKKDGTWTEEQTNSFVLKKDVTLVHKSHAKIMAFESGVVTCAYDEHDSKVMLNSALYEDVLTKWELIEDFTPKAKKHVSTEYVYTMKVPAGTRVDEYFNEYRFEMNEKIEINLIGEMGTVRVKDNTSNTKIYGGNTISVFTKKS